MGMGTGVDGAGDVVVQVFGLAQSPLNADTLAFRPMGGRATFPDAKSKAGAASLEDRLSHVCGQMQIGLCHLLKT
jgi:hypothetical protein